jgi:hypothetical protein
MNLSLNSMSIKNYLLSLCLGVNLLSGVSNICCAQSDTPPPIDIVLCVDLSGSTNGIIEHIRNHFWHFVQELEQLQPRPDYRFGFVGYSRPSFGKDNAYVKVIRDLSYDNESLSNEMFSLKAVVEQGSQFVGAALMNCIKNLRWSKEDNAVKVIFLTGNGFVNADGKTYKKACELAAMRGIIIHSLYWQSYTLPRELPGWREIAGAAGGKFFNVNVGYNHTGIDTGFDTQKLSSLNEELNSTYLYYGKDGKTRYKMMAAQDENILEVSPRGFRYRMAYKTSARYQKKNSSWDLVDLFSKLDTLEKRNFDTELLPDSLQKMNDSRFYEFIVQKNELRNQVLAKIHKLVKARETQEREALRIRLEEQKRRNEPPDEIKPSIDNLILMLMVEEARKKGFTKN